MVLNSAALSKYSLSDIYCICDSPSCLCQLLLSAHAVTLALNHPLSVSFMTSAKLVFFASLQVIVFEEQETDGKIQFTSSPDYGMSVDV